MDISDKKPIDNQSLHSVKSSSKKSPLSEIKPTIVEKKESAKKLSEINLKLLHLDLEDRLNDYAQFTDVAVLEGFYGFRSSVIRKVERSSEEKIKLNSELLASVIRATPNSLNCSRTVALKCLAKYYELALKNGQKSELNIELERKFKFASEISEAIDNLQDQTDLVGEDKNFLFNRTQRDS